MQGKIISDPQPHLLSWLAEKLIEASPDTAAKSFQSLATHEAVLLLKPLKAQQVVACLNQMDAVKAAAILRRFPSRQGAHILARLNVPQAATVYAAFSQPQKEKMKTLLPAGLVQTFSQAQAWPADSAGARMQRDFVSFKTETKVADMMEKLKNWPRKKFPTVCLVLGKNGELKGAIRSSELAFLAPASLAGSVMGPIESVQAKHPAHEALALLRQGQLLVPVLDEQQIVLGVLSWGDLWQEPKAKKYFKWF